MFDGYGRPTGYGQTAPGRDLPNLDPQGRPGRPPRSGQPNINAAIQGGMPVGGTTPFQGAQQTTQPPQTQHYTAPNGNTGIAGGLPGGAGVPPVQSGPSPTAGLAPQAPAAAPPQNDVYAPIDGFDFDKLRGVKKYDSAQKYSDAVRAFSKGLGSGVQISRNNLGGMVDYAKANGFGNAQAVGDDKIDFGDGEGPIDVIRANGKVWFQNGADRFAKSAPAQGPVMSPLGLSSAILGTQPTLNAGSSDAQRQQILQALQVDPRLMSMGKQFGY